MLDRLVPNSVSCAETREDLLDVELFSVELESLGRAVEARRREFMTGRGCARAALEQLGAPVVGIPSGAHGEPLWPAGVIGSITHCRGYRACAVAWSGPLVALGIDAEPNTPLPDGLLEEVAHGPELDLVLGPAPDPAGSESVELPRLLFSAKEAVYKAWFTLAGRWLGFDQVEIVIDRAEFRARLLVPGPIIGGKPIAEFTGRWALEDGVICTAVVACDHGDAAVSSGI